MRENPEHSDHQKISENEIPEGFTLSMAFMDTLPVIFFSLSAAVLALRFRSILFLAGAVLVILAGALKASWKFVLACAGRDISFLSRQMRYTMPAGFLLMILSLITDSGKWTPHAVLRHVVSFPSWAFFILAAVGIGFMVWFARTLNDRDARSNWIEQGVNTLAQLFIFLGILL